jgi:lysophospholipase L1-like esterase
VVTIDYALNDRGIGLEKAGAAWRSMIESALARDVKVILLTPTADEALARRPLPPEGEALERHAELVRELAAAYGVGLADSLAAFKRRLEAGEDLASLLSTGNHPNRAGHEIVAKEILRWFRSS